MTASASVASSSASRRLPRNPATVAMVPRAYPSFHRSPSDLATASASAPRADASSRPPGVQGDLGQQVERGGGLELIARRPAQLERGQRELGRGWRAARHRELSAPGQGGPAHGIRRGRGAGQREEGVDTSARLRRRRRARSRPAGSPLHSRSPVSASPSGPALAEHLAQVRRLGVHPAEHVDARRPRAGHDRHAERDQLLALAHRVLTAAAAELGCLARHDETAGGVVADGLQHPVPGLAEYLRTRSRAATCRSGRHQVEDVARGQQCSSAQTCSAMSRDHSAKTDSRRSSTCSGSDSRS